MGRRKLPTFSPAGASTEKMAGRKRKGASLAPLALSKRRARASDGWASLPTDIVGLVLRWLLIGGGDIVDYIVFRAVCFLWRACTRQLRDADLRNRLARPHGWVALCGGDAVRADDACEIAFFHTRTGRSIRVHLPELRRHRIVGFTDGLVILLHKSTTAVRVLHPFTRVAVDLPPLARVYRRELGRWKYHLLVMNSVVCDGANSANSIAVVVWFPSRTVVLAAEPGDSDWKVLHRHQWYVKCMLPYQGRLYAIAASREIVQLYPPRLEGSPAVVAHIPVLSGYNYPAPAAWEFFLVESGGQMLVAARYPHDGVRFRLWVVHLHSSGGSGKLIMVTSLGDRALFLSRDRCLSVSARDLPSLSSNSIYYSLTGGPVDVHSLRTGLSEQLTDQCQIHDKVNRIRPSVRPFTIVDHLLTYCHHREWAEGLMFHEFYLIPQSFTELMMSINAKNSQLRIPRIRDE